MGRILAAAARSVAEVPSVGVDRSGRGAGEVHRQRCVSRQFARGESDDWRRRWWRIRVGRVNRDVAGFCLRLIATGASNFEAHRVAARAGIGMRRILCRARLSVTEGPGVGSDTAGRVAGKSHRQRDCPSGLIGGECGDRWRRSAWNGRRNCNVIVFRQRIGTTGPGYRGVTE